jgi:hypothetical protein
VTVRLFVSYSDVAGGCPTLGVLVESGVCSAGQAAALKTLSDQQLLGAKGYLSVD